MAVDSTSPPLTSRTVRDVTVMPLETDKAAANPFGVSAWLRDGTPVEDVYLRRPRGRSWQPPRQPADRSLDGHHVYGGILFKHYGHFLVDTLARYWYLRDHPREPVVWHTGAHDWPPRRLLAWQRQIFDLLGLWVEAEQLVGCPTEIEQLTIPDPGIEVWPHPPPPMPQRHADALGVYQFHAPTDKRVWLSRRQWHKAPVEREDRLEAMLVADGWTILHPQSVTVEEQLECMSDASVIAGFSGSAFHTLLLAFNIGATVVIVPRSLNFGSVGTYEAIAAAKGFRQVVLDTPLVPLREGESDRPARGQRRGDPLVPHRLRDPAGLVRALGRM